MTNSLEKCPSVDKALIKVVVVLLLNFSHQLVKVMSS